MSRYCPHGEPEPLCDGGRGAAPCLSAEYVYCAHGVDSRQRTKEGEARCAYCRGITRRYRNPDTWRRAAAPAAP